MKELVPILLAVVVWSRAWQGLQVLVRSDNMTEVEVLHSCTSRQHELMQLLQAFHFISVRHDISLSAQHFMGHHNMVADALSRKIVPMFFSSTPQARPQPTSAPQALWQLVVEDQPDLLLPSWRRKLKSI